MYKLKPINLDNGVTQIHPLRTVDLQRQDELVNDLFEILSDTENTQFIPEKRVTDKKTISDHLFGVTLSYDQQFGYTHYITLKKYNKVIGQIDILTPKRIEQKYGVKDTWFIEYFLNKHLWGHGVMSGAICAVINNLKGQGIDNIAALCMPSNVGSVKILEKAGFIRTRQFDMKQDYFELR